MLKEIKSGLNTKIAIHPIIIQIEVDNIRGQLNQANLNIIPETAIKVMILNKIQPDNPLRAIKQNGVQVPAIKTKIIL